ncbi:MAG TPA: chorismate mutase [Rhodopila sp.]|nr:chorismate mutase [Rhodopila sp.]
MEDDWRNGGLPALRAELDRIDNAIHDLLMQRAEVVEHVARSGKPAAFRPGREAAMLRRLLARHHGTLPPVTVVRIWREMLAGTTAMQGGFSLAVADAAPSAPFCQLAREHFGALTPLSVHQTPGHALAEVSRRRAAGAVLPYPSETDPWWTALLRREPRLHIIAQLPFWAPRPAGAAPVKALVVGATQADPSGSDRSFIGIECDRHLSHTRLCNELAAAGLKPRSLVLLHPPGTAPIILAETDGFLADDDPRLSRPILGSHHPLLLGHAAIPVGEAA